jgi:hypothetical protein
MNIASLSDKRIDRKCIAGDKARIPRPVDCAAIAQ